jgi:peptidoglycan/xylan/chitin deacetylase (PgdA/CDA1 family)
MTTSLWSANTPAHFWCCEPSPSPERWEAAVLKAAPLLDLPVPTDNLDQLLAAVLGEGQFGPDHWQLSRAKRAYYEVKPYLPRAAAVLLRRFYQQPSRIKSSLGWPIEGRYVRFLWQVMRELLAAANGQSLTFRHFWPGGRQFAIVLTHDIETATGQDHVRRVVDLEESLGFRSSFNFVPERYPVDRALMNELRARGFEIGCHGLKHDGKLFRTHAEFQRRAERINGYLKEFGAVGFRSPLTLRQPEWMQSLDVEYDLSFFDTDPYEPMPGGSMCIWPYRVGRFVELPYTLAQDNTLTMILGETTPRLWLTKLDFIEQNHGMALINSHPDYLIDKTDWQVYSDFLHCVSERRDVWRALPLEMARWWTVRAGPLADFSAMGGVLGRVSLPNDVEDAPLGVTIHGL